jgi:tRNA A37 threonylcarbamoyladenosine dehydratase
MLTQFSRTSLIYGEDAIKNLRKSKVAVFGIGGVGGYVIEALGRSGVGNIDIFDNDDICLTNLNRQIIATHNTIGKSKVEVAKSRLLEINKEINVNAYKVFYLPENSEQYDFSNYDYIVDAIDTVSAKIELVLQANKHKTPIISSMGTGNKIHPQLLEVDDIYKTSNCPLARVMRKELKKRNIKSLKVVYSKEMPIEPKINLKELEASCSKRQIPGSTAFVPATAGLIIASEVVNYLVKQV